MTRAADERLQGAASCPSCGGVAVGPRALGPVLEAAGVPVAVLPQLFGEGVAGPACPACASTMKTASLKGLPVDGCVRCGTLWLDRSELGRLTRETFVDHAPPPPPPPPHSIEGRMARFLAGQFIEVWQQANTTEVRYGVNTRKAYAVETAAGTGTATEEGDDLIAALRRQFFRGSLPLSFEVCGHDGPTLLKIHRGYRFLFSRTEVWDAEGLLLGVVRERFSWLTARYELFDGRGRKAGSVIRRLLHPWRFPVLDRDGEEIALVERQFPGLVRMLFTDADHFRISFRPGADGQEVTPRLRALVLATVLAIDFDRFSPPQKRGGHFAAALVESAGAPSRRRDSFRS